MEQFITFMKGLRRNYSLIRNIGIIAHIDAGKTTTTERLINRTGLTKRAGSVDTGDTVMDYLPEERERGITITAAAITLPWRRHRINLIDTPGHVDFTVEVERSLRVIDGAVVILDASKGIQAQTLTVWRQAQRHNLKSFIYINKMDKIGADLKKCLKDIQSTFGLEPILLNEPVMQNEEFKSVKAVDVTKMEFQEQICQFDDEFLQKYLNETDSILDVQAEVKSALARITRDSKAIGVFVGSSAKDIGTEFILDGIVDLLPAPAEGKSGSFKALAFKVVFDEKRNGFLVYCRVYSGRFSGKRSQIYNLSRGKREQVGKIMQAMADELIEVESAAEGQIVILTGLKDTATGDTLSDDCTGKVLEGISIPTPVISVSVEADSPGAQDHLDKCLEIIQLEDPSVRVQLDPSTGQTKLSGMGELHLEIVESRLRREMKAKFTTGPIAIAFQERLIFSQEEEGKIYSKHFELDQEILGIQLKGSVDVKIVPSGEFGIVYREGDEEVRNVVEEAVLSAFGRGPLGGNRVDRNCRVLIENLQFNTANSARLVVFKAVQNLLKDCASAGNLILREPLVRVELDSPEEFVGDITADLFSARRCVDCETLGDGRIWARAPLRKMLGYSNWLRSRTGGRVSFTMEADGYTDYCN